MLVFSGLGALLSERFLNHARFIMPIVFLAIGSILIGYGLYLDRVLDLIGTFDYGWRLVFCFGLIFPPAFLMGFPMATAMTTLGRLGKDHMFLWAWGINGCFSVDRRGRRAAGRDVLRACRRARSQRRRLPLGNSGLLRDTPAARRGAPQGSDRVISAAGGAGPGSRRGG